MEEGRANPATSDESPDLDLVTVNGKRESSSGSGLLSVIAKMTLTETRQVAILARIEYWSLAGPPVGQSFEDFEFLAEASTWPYNAQTTHWFREVSAGIQ
jgi:hypothetical protein